MGKYNTKEKQTVVNFIQEIKNLTNTAYTQKGAEAYKTTENPMLDLFGSVASLRNADIARMHEVFRLFDKAYAQDQEMASRLIFWLRDIRGGAGERKIFRSFILRLAYINPAFVIANFDNIAEYGRYDDFLILLDSPLRIQVLSYLEKVLRADILAIIENKPMSLLAKWLPSENASSEITKRYAKIIRKSLNLTPKAYRQTLSILRGKLNIVEKTMSAKQWNKIDFPSVPSRAGMIYSKAFLAHSEQEYLKFLEDVALGKVSMKASTLYPYDIVNRVLEHRDFSPKGLVEKKVLNLLWQNLPNYLDGIEENILCLVDVSGSMFSSSYGNIPPICLSISLGIYTAERNKGLFKDKFITFSEKPSLETLEGETFFDRVKNLENADWGYCTNIESAFNLILNAAKRVNADPKEMVSKLIIISDMQFDKAADRKDGTKFMPLMKKKFETAGYTMPSLVFWNVNAVNSVVHQTVADMDFCMVSGASPSIFTGILKGDIEIEVVNEKGEIEIQTQLDPIEVMKQTLMDARYDNVVIV